ncbi:MAG: zinc ribbon domain-containing protein [Acidobacteriota bacterium]|nr:zinc ribbon domain-containing protein [Acidobacteriota bacterium]
MYCPQCGQQQVSDAVRFCSRCGFLLEGVTAVIASGGIIPARYIQPRNQQLSPRSKGVRQGAMLMLSTLLVVPIVAILSVQLFYESSSIIIPLAALFCFVGGLLRMLYALLMEDAYPQKDMNQMEGYAPPASPQFERFARNNALPPAAATSASGSRRQPKTGEIAHPPSVTENTTRLLDKEDPKRR